VPPNNAAVQDSLRLNEALESVATQNGWAWVDSAAGLRDGEFFAEGMSSDGVHPTQEGARVIGEAIQSAVLEAAGAG
ncbi:MAG TPA: hypothetical protein H9830_03345, partial [Candidatus Agrococcus pullicola]|nr:hypothetical protein [Candidatus Agrococcus pullicola]